MQLRASDGSPDPMATSARPLGPVGLCAARWSHTSGLQGNGERERASASETRMGKGENESGEGAGAARRLPKVAQVRARRVPVCVPRTHGLPHPTYPMGHPTYPVACGWRFPGAVAITPCAAPSTLAHPWWSRPHSHARCTPHAGRQNNMKQIGLFVRYYILMAVASGWQHSLRLFTWEFPGYALSRTNT